MSDELLAAANKGNAHAQYVIGCKYSLGQGVEQDQREAVRWWQKAADQNHPGAQYNLGHARMKGNGIPVDSVASYLMFRDAARGYKQWVQEGVRFKEMDVSVARRQAARMRLLVLPFYILRSLPLLLSSVGIGRFRMFRQATNSFNEKLAERIIDSGMDVNAPARSGNTPLLQACGVGSTAVVHLLIERGADVNRRGKGRFCAPPIHAAAQSGELSVVELLLAHGADVNAAAPDESTALMVAAIQGNAAIVQSLIVAGADVNATCKPQRAGTLQLAAQGGFSETVILLLEAGANPHATAGKHQETPLFSAAQSGDVPTMKALAEAGANVKATNDTGITPLHRAALDGQTAAARYLIQAGADIRARGSTDAYTPLHVAAMGGAKDTVLLLLEAGADVNECSSSGLTALQIAESRRDMELVQLLQDHGAEE